MRDDLGPGLDELASDHQRGRLADVVGLGLERQAPQGEAMAREILAEDLDGLLEEEALLVVVDLLGGLDDRHGNAELLRGVDERLRVLGEAGAAVAAAGVEEGPSRCGSRFRPRRRTSSTSTPMASQKRAISFMNEMRVASMALAAYFVISAASFAIRMIGFPERTKGS